jgi:hypothetical protein
MNEIFRVPDFSFGFNFTLAIAAQMFPFDLAPVVAIINFT